MNEKLKERIDDKRYRMHVIMADGLSDRKAALKISNQQYSGVLSNVLQEEMSNEIRLHVYEEIMGESYLYHRQARNEFNNRLSKRIAEVLQNLMQQSPDSPENPESRENKEKT